VTVGVVAYLRNRFLLNIYTDPAALILFFGSRYGRSFTTRRLDQCFLRPRSSFPLESCLRFFSAIEFSVGTAYGFGDEYIARLLNPPTAQLDPNEEDYIKQNLQKLPPAKTGVYRFQHDILAMVRAPWKARLCEWHKCSKPFIPDKGSRRCCSKACSNQADRARKLRW
jgi:hypothetical protein